LLDKGWQIKEISAEYVTLQKNVCLKCRLLKGWDLGHTNEIYEEKAYGIELGEYVVDVGASNGDSAIYSQSIVHQKFWHWSQTRTPMH
jgi:hypothetical protein